MINVLEAIVDYKRELLTNIPDYNDLELSERDFKRALRQPEFAFIMECKKASPSKGVIRSNFDLNDILPVYNKYADAISVLTEDRFFHGSFNNLKFVSDNSTKPILCKDFILEPKQVRQARYFGADAVLLMLSVLNDHEYQLCHAQAKALNMDVLTEIHNTKELSRAIALGSEIIGINNRNLKNLETSLSVTRELATLVPKDRIVITESGINNHQDILNLAPYADACLVGSSLMGKADLESAARNLVYGDIKVCGVTNQNDADFIEQGVASSLGVIFAEKSKRKIGTLITASKKPLIGVFQNQTTEFVIEKFKEFKLHGIQLHGDESQEYIDQLRSSLGGSVFISKVLHVDDRQSYSDFSLPDYQGVDEILLDSQMDVQQGGTGEAFDWLLLENQNLKFSEIPIRIAGGIEQSNIQKLKQLGFSKLDVCTGSEQSAGIKSPEKIRNIFTNSKILARYSANGS